MGQFARLAVKMAERVIARFNLDGTGYVTGPGGNYSGQYVDRCRALESSTFFACMNLVGSTIASLGFDVYRESKSGSREIASDHPLHEVIKYEPNDHSTAIEFWQREIWDQELSGNAYAKVVRDSRNDIIGLIPWEPERVTLLTDQQQWVYKNTRSTGEPEKISERGKGGLCNILHLRNVTTDGKCGLSTVDLASQRLGLDLAVEKYGAMFFGKGGRVKDIFEIDGTPTPEQREKFKAIFRENYGNADSFHDVLAIERGLKYVGKSGSTPNEAQFLETQIQNSIALCRFLGVPPTLVGILDRATYNNQEQLMLQFLTLGLTPRVERIEQAMRRALLRPEEKKQGFFIHSKVQKILRGDMKARGEYYKTMASLGALNVEEIRDLEDMPRIGTPEAAEYRRAQNIFGPDTPEPAADTSTETESQRAAA